MLCNLKGPNKKLGRPVNRKNVRASVQTQRGKPVEWICKNFQAEVNPRVGMPCNAYRKSILLAINKAFSEVIVE